MTFTDDKPKDLTITALAAALVVCANVALLFDIFDRNADCLNNNLRAEAGVLLDTNKAGLLDECAP
jgi:hypothetical protein